MDQYNVKTYAWTGKNSEYLAVMDSVKNVIGKRQN